jgi:hypothetical protein
VESLALDEDSLKDYVPLIHRYPLESHRVGAVAQLGAEAQPIFRLNWEQHTHVSSFSGPSPTVAEKPTFMT